MRAAASPLTPLKHVVGLDIADWQTDDETPLDPELYRRRQAIEQLNAWLDGFKTLLVRLETCLHTWLAFHWLAFAVLLPRRLGRTPTS